jgi:hypothetical protein
MRRLVGSYLIATYIAVVACVAWQDPPAHAQAGGSAVAVGFRNELKTPVVVQGYTLVNGMKKYGTAMVILPGKISAENNIPVGSVRFYTVVDANRPNQIQHVNDAPIKIGPQDLFIGIRGMPPKVFLEPLQ